MSARAWVGLLRFALPRLGLAWPGFRRVRGQVVKRLRRRAQALGLDADGYRARLESVPEEWAQLDSYCRIPISRFFRDRDVFEALESTVLPALAEATGERALRAWSIGCASGEEPYSLTLLARLAGIRLEVLATDVEAHLLERARAARYKASSLRELPAPRRERAFERVGELYELRPAFRAGVRFALADIRAELPDGPFDLVLCRNLVLTYFSRDLARATLVRIASVMEPGAALAIGRHERLPSGLPFEPWRGRLGIFRRSA